MERQGAELEHLRELGAREREILALRLEDILLKSNVLHASGTDRTSTDGREYLERTIAEMHAQIEAKRVE